MKVVGVDRLQRLCAGGADVGGAMGAWLAEMREAKFHELAELVSRFPQAAARPDGAMRIFLGVAGNWVDIRMNCAAGVVLISDAGVARRRRA